MTKLYLNQKKYLELQQQIEGNLDLYTADESWLAVELGINDKNGAGLYVSYNSDRSADDLENAISLHKHYIDLPYTLASDGCFWTLLAHTEYWDYMRERWPLEEAKKDRVAYIGRRYFFQDKGRARHGLARLWWFAELSYDETLENPYYYTELMLKDQDLAGQIIENMYLSRNKLALKALFKMLDYLRGLESSGVISEIGGKQRFLIRDAAQYFNLVGAVEMWDILSVEEAGDKLIAWAQDYLKEINVWNATIV